MNTTTVELIIPKPGELSLAALESMPADLRLLFGWPRLLALVLDAVLAVGPDATGNSQRTARLLTLMAYCYTSNLLTCEDITAACYEEADVAYILDGETVSAGELRAFRRNHRDLVEKCLQNLFYGALAAACGKKSFDTVESNALSAGVQEFARRRLGLAVVFDTAMSE